MRAVTGSINRGLEIGSTLDCADNSGAKKLKIISVKSAGGSVRKRRPRAGVADLAFVRVLKGKRELKGEIHSAVIIRQKKEFARASGVTITFDDNAAVLVDDMNMPKGNKIKGAVAKEAVERWPLIGKVASIVV